MSKELSQDVKALFQKQEAAIMEIGRLEPKIGELSNDIKALHARAEELRTENAKLTSDTNEKRIEYANLDKKVKQEEERLYKEAQEVARKAQVVDQSKKAFEEEKLKYLAEIEYQKGIVKDALDVIVKRENDLKIEQNNVESLKKDISSSLASAKDADAKAQAKLAEADANVKATKEATVNAKRLQDEVTSTLKQHKATLAELEAKKDDYDKRFQALTDASKSVNAKQDELSERERWITVMQDKIKRATQKLETDIKLAQIDEERKKKVSDVLA